MSAAAILEDLRHHGVEVRLDGENIRLRKPSGFDLPPDLIHRARQAKPALITYLSSLRTAETTITNPIVGEWRERLAALSVEVPACPGFRHWPSVRREALRFLDERGGEAIDLGWGVLDLLGVHRGVGTVRADCSGALLGLRGRPIIELTTHLIRFADGLAYRRRPMLAGLTIPVWQYGENR